MSAGREESLAAGPYLPGEPRTYNAGPLLSIPGVP